MIILDAHQDIAYNNAIYGRDYRTSALELRQREAGQNRPPATIGLPDALLGRVAIVFSTLYAAPQQAADALEAQSISYSTPQQAYAVGLRQLDYYQRLADEDARIRLIRTTSDLDAVLATWADGQEVGQHQQGLVVLMEGADPIVEPAQFEEWYARGVRIVGPAWSQTRYSGGTGAPGGLSSLGRELLEVMAGYNALLDLSHLAEKAYYEALDQYSGPVIASHSNPRKFRNSDRHLTDEMIRLLAEHDGVMGIVLYNRFLSDDYGATGTKRDVPLSTVIAAIDHVCQVTGSARHVGLGSDFDGGFGANHIPDGLDTVSDLLRIGEVLRKRGYAEADIEGILSGNMLRQLRRALPA